MNRIRVLIADDHAVVRAGLRLLLNAQPDLEVVAEAADGREALARCRETDPDVVTLDLTMPGDGSMQVIVRLREECPRTRVLVLTMHDDAAYLRVALAAGASGYVTKSAADTELLAAIRAVHHGRTFVDLSLGQGALSAGPVIRGAEARPDAGRRAQRLSRRETEVLHLLAHGHTNQWIAEHLQVSIKTVETYRARLADKLNLYNRADYVRYAVNTGLVAPGTLPPASRE